MEVVELKSRDDVDDSAHIRAADIQVEGSVRIAANVDIDVNRLILGHGATIDRDVRIRAETLDLGQGARVEARCQVAGMASAAKLIRIGEHSFLGHDSKLLVPVAVIGDYVKIQNHALLNGRKPLLIGHNCWIGQNAIINSEDNLTIGNNVGIGMSCIYTHGYFGDRLEGCQVFKVAPVVIGDDVWILGSFHVISPGVTIGEKSLIMPGSIVTHDVPPNHTIGGSPAKDLTERFVPFKNVEPREKFEMIRGFLQEYMDNMYLGKYEILEDGFRVHAAFGRFRIVLISVLDDKTMLPDERPLLVFSQENRRMEIPDAVTVFDLARRQYTRTRSEAEIRTISFLGSYRARFVPTDQPKVKLPEEYRNF